MSIINESFQKKEDSKSESQEKNIGWWQNNPMSYDWTYIPDDVEVKESDLAKIDSEFWNISREFAHPDHPNEPYFGRLINYKILPYSDVLEIGCGMGSHASLLAPTSKSYTGIDITKKASNITRVRLDQKKLSFKSTVLRCDAEKMPFDDNSFDYVWSWGVIHHSANTVSIIDEIYRVMKPGAEGLIMVYNRNSIRYLWYGLYQGIFKLKFLKYKSLYEVNMTYTDGYIARHYTAKEVKREFSKFSKIDTSVADCGIPSLGFGWGRLSKIFPNITGYINKYLNKKFGWFLVVHVKK